jgi:hypothetical protein
MNLTPLMLFAMEFVENAPRAKMTIWKKFRAYVYLSITAHIILNLIYEPLSNQGVFDSMINSTIFNIVPPKVVKDTDTTGAPPYHPITGDKEIRLLVLEPGTPGGELKCRLINVQSCWRTRYEALSYAWGDESSKRQISLSGSTKEVTGSLFDALSDLRYLEYERLIWVDPLCINQDDEDEKTKQIRLMGDIYSRARHVIIYLGRKDVSVENAIDSIRKLDRRFVPLYRRRWSSHFNEIFPISGMVKDAFLGMNTIGDNEVDWGQIIMLFSRPWFKRTWVIQEAILPKRVRVVCGEQSIPWAMLERVVVGMSDYHSAGWTIPGYHLIHDITARIDLIESARQTRYTGIQMPDVWLCRRLLSCLIQKYHIDNEGGPKLLDFAWENHSFLCKDPRDKIFGMLGVAGQDVSSEYVKPRYDLSPEDVFRRFVLWELLHNNNLGILGISSDKPHDFSAPSWVPDFTRLDPHNSLSGWRNRQKFNASAGLSSQVQTSNNETVLHLKGRVIGTLHTIVKELVQDPTEALRDNKEVDNDALAKDQMQVNKAMIEEARDIWFAAMKRSNKASCSIPQPESIFWTEEKNGKLVSKFWGHEVWDPFVRTLICDRSKDGRYDHGNSSSFMMAVVHLALGGHFPVDQPKEYMSFLARKSLGAFLALTRLRHFAGTVAGLAGYVPKKAREGDTVVMLHGADVPFVLRKKPDGRYLLIGECYLHGIMNGEALEASEARSQDTVFTID